MELQEIFARELELFQTMSQDCLRRVLVFPCINSYSRLKLHEVTKEKFADLTSFSGMLLFVLQLHSVWKSQNLSITLILREIKFAIFGI